MKYFKIYIFFTLIIILLFLINNNNIESFYFEPDTSTTTTTTSTENNNDNLETDCEDITNIKDSLKKLWDNIPDDKYKKSNKEENIIIDWNDYLSRTPNKEDYCDMGAFPNCCD